MESELIFRYPDLPHERRHGPMGYLDYTSMKPWLRDEFAFRCIYCLDREKFSSDGEHRFAVEHVEPKSASPQRKNDYENVVYSCTRCNTLKGTLQIPCPIEYPMASVIRCEDTGEFVAVTAVGQELIDTLQLNDQRRVEIRFSILAICRESRANETLEQVARKYLEFPPNLPDLRRLVPPSGNSRPDGVNECHFVKREENRLQGWY